MAIYDHKYGELPYLRVYRSWGGKEYQEYVRIKGSRKAAYAKAREIDERLAQEQHQYAVAQSRTRSYHVRPDGSIRGLRRVRVEREGRTPVEVYELRINVPWEKRVKRTTISIAVHGEQNGFELAVGKICEWYDLSPDSDVAKALMDQASFYLSEKSGMGVADMAIQKAKEEFATLTGGLVKSFKRFTASTES